MEKWKSQGRGWYTTKLNSTLRIFIVIMVHGTFRGSIQVRRTSRGRLYHWAIANDRGTAKLLSFELHTGCAIYAKLVSTQVRVPPGARNFYRRKFISFFPFLLSVFVSVETSTLSSSTRALPRDKEEFLPLTEYRWCLSLWTLVFLECPDFIWLLLLRMRFPQMGVEPGIAGSPSTGFYHWATVTVGN